MGEVARKPWVEPWVKPYVTACVKPCVFLAIFGLVLLGSSGCGSDLGECDHAALALTTDALMTRPYDGQRLVHETCASGQCHSETAKGEARVGAPAELNFDLVPATSDPAELTKVTRGASTVYELAEEMWTWIDGGTMPPAGLRPPLTGASKEIVRNWLACGAPVVKKPPMAGPDWAQLYPSLSGCGACHGAASMSGAWYTADACTTRANLLAGTAVSAGCSATGSMLVVPSNPDASLLLQKLELPMPCGPVMPLDRPPSTPSPMAEPLREWIAAGALAPGCP